MKDLWDTAVREITPIAAVALSMLYLLGSLLGSLLGLTTETEQMQPLAPPPPPSPPSALSPSSNPALPSPKASHEAAENDDALPFLKRPEEKPPTAQHAAQQHSSAPPPPKAPLKAAERDDDSDEDGIYDFKDLEPLAALPLSLPGTVPPPSKAPHKAAESDDDNDDEGTFVFCDFKDSEPLVALPLSLPGTAPPFSQSSSSSSSSLQTSPAADTPSTVSKSSILSMQCALQPLPPRQAALADLVFCVATPGRFTLAQQATMSRIFGYLLPQEISHWEKVSTNRHRLSLREPRTAVLQDIPEQGLQEVEGSQFTLAQEAFFTFLPPTPETPYPRMAIEGLTISYLMARAWWPLPAMWLPSIAVQSIGFTLGAQMTCTARGKTSALPLDQALETCSALVWQGQG